MNRLKEAILFHLAGLFCGLFCVAINVFAVVCGKWPFMLVNLAAALLSLWWCGMEIFNLCQDVMKYKSEANDG